MNTPIADTVFVNMRKYIIIFVFLLAPVLAIENTNVVSPVGSGRAPLTRGQEGLIRSPNPIDTRYNLVVTGNVGEGRHFRGVVPYQSPSTLSVGGASSTLDSFLRRSGDSIYVGNYSGQSQRYYSPTRTVTRSRAGQQEILRPPVSSSFKYSTERSVAAPRISQADRFSYLDITAANVSVRPMSRTTQELEKTFLSELEEYVQGDEPADIRRMERLGKFKRDVEEVAKRSAKFKEELDEDVKEQLEAEELRGEFGEISFDIFEQMKRQVGESQEEASSDEESEEGDVERSKFSSVVTKGHGVLGSHKTFASVSEDKFNKHMRAAESYLREGRYYRAADIYTLASILKPEDALAYAGKSHALFAAGEYMSSALFLSRALEIFGGYGQVRIDIEEMMGGRDTLESRIVDVEEVLERSDVPELRFLLGYVYYQMGRLDVAKESIDAAYEKMSDSSAVAALRKAIYSAVNNSN